MSTRKKLATAGGALLLLSLLMSQSCIRAEWARRHIKPGMTLAQVLNANDSWWMFSGISEPPGSDSPLFRALREDGGTYSLHLGGATEDKTLGSKEELVQIIQQQMSNGHAWNMSFTYLGSPRSTFGISFDAQGRVQEASSVAGPS
jgi:hypothetical protein